MKEEFLLLHQKNWETNTRAEETGYEKQPENEQLCPSVKAALSQCQSSPVMLYPAVNSTDCHNYASNGTSLENSDFIRKTELW